MPDAIRIIRRGEVQSRTGLCRSAIYQSIADGRFPRPVSLGPRAVGWVEAEVVDWLRSRVAARPQPATPAVSPAGTKSNKAAGA